MKQRTPEWFAARRGRITASKIPDIIRDPDDAMIDHVRDKLNLSPRFTGNEATKYGERMEPKARQWLEQHFGKPIQEIGFVIYEHNESFGASPDGFLDAGHIVEIKCPYYGDIPDHPDPRHVDQVMWQMGVCQAQKCTLLYYAPEPEVPSIFEIRFDKRHWDRLNDAAAKFLAAANKITDLDNWLKEHDRTPVDRSHDEEYALAENVWLEAKRRADAAQATLDAAAGRLRTLSDGRAVKGSKTKLVWISRKGSVQWEKFLKSYGIDKSAPETFRKGATHYARIEEIKDADA